MQDRASTRPSRTWASEGPKSEDRSYRQRQRPITHLPVPRQQRAFAQADRGEGATTKGATGRRGGSPINCRQGTRGHRRN